jgi:hypothetical protein
MHAPPTTQATGASLVSIVRASEAEAAANQSLVLAKRSKSDCQRLSNYRSVYYFDIRQIVYIHNLIGHKIYDAYCLDV